jgi:hypothetical protein
MSDFDSNPINHNHSSTWLLGQATFTYCCFFGNVLAFLGAGGVPDAIRQAQSCKKQATAL